MAGLQKNLGLVDVFAISTGAMFSSGLFLLPGLAATQTGLSAAFAYLIAGFLMLPALLSQAELVPAGFARLGRFGTPTWGIVFTSAAIGLCVVAFEVGTIAKLASAFQLVLFSLLNLCVIVIRESRLERPGAGAR